MAPPPPAPGLLRRPPEEGARLLALSFLDQAAAARPRLDDPADAEALHDFRVGLRRLRSCLKAYDEHLEGSIPGKLARRLRRLARATGAGRDAEVQLEWLRDRARHLAAFHRSGSAWLLERLEERRRAAYEEITSEVAQEFAGVEADLRRKLSVYRTEVHLGEDRTTLGRATAEVLARQAAELGEHLAKVGGAGDEEQAHEARIAAKRLRYLLEPLAGESELAGARAVVKRLKALQDLLGELHDAHVLEVELGRALEEAAADRARRLLALTLVEVPDERLLRAERRRYREPALLALARLNRARRDRLFAALSDEWLGGRAEPFLGEVETLVPALAGEEPGAAPEAAAPAGA